MNKIPPKPTSLPVDSVVFREDLYPRINKDPKTVQKYAEDLAVLPPIELNQRNELIDGWHRWTAHRKNGETTIPVIITETQNDAHLLELAIERNAAHGLQLSQEDKRNMARTIYHVTPDRDRDAKKKHLAKILSVSDRTVRDWLGRIDKDAKAERNRRIFELWMQCHTQQEISETVGVPQQTVARKFTHFGNLAELGKSERAVAEHAIDFEPPIYNIWKQQTKTNGASHFGNSEIRWVDNLLYLYTNPFDTILDPFAGSGSTLDIARKRYRRAYISDRKPIVERADAIRQHDLITSDGTIQLPRVPSWKETKLVYLDPPYWRQAAGKYSNDPTDLANMPLEDFNRALAGIIKAFAGKLTDAYIALIIQPTQWKADDHTYTDHVADMLSAVDLPLNMRYSAPYESQQHTPQMVDWAKENRKCLVLTREIVVWRIP